MKKATKWKLVLGREVVKALVVELRDAHLQDARGGIGTSNLKTCGNLKSMLLGEACTSACPTIDQ